MIDDRKNRYFDVTAGEWIEAVHFRLLDDVVSLWGIVPTGRRAFLFEGSDLVEFVRRCILVLLKHGAKPVREGKHSWEFETKYGENHDDIAEGVIADWLATGGGDPEWGEFSFALPYSLERQW